jgi:hypothetical protein
MRQTSGQRQNHFAHYPLLRNNLGFGPIFAIGGALIGVYHTLDALADYTCNFQVQQGQDDCPFGVSTLFRFGI